MINLTELLKSSPEKIIDLYEADLRTIKADAPVLYYFSDTTELGTEVTFATKVYEAYPLEVTGFEWTGNGQLPTPRLKISNINHIITAYNIIYDDLLGAKITRIRTMFKYLDAGPAPDPTAKFPDEVYYIDRKVSENSSYVEYELVSALDISSIKLPRRMVIQNICPWKYKDSTTCKYTYSNPPKYYKEDGTETTILAEDVCGKRLSDCKLRFGATNVLNFGGYPGAGLFR